MSLQPSPLSRSELGSAFSGSLENLGDFGLSYSTCSRINPESRKQLSIENRIYIRGEFTREQLSIEKRIYIRGEFTRKQLSIENRIYIRGEFTRQQLSIENRIYIRVEFTRKQLS